jgi:predicted nucleic acid-binding protein
MGSSGSPARKSTPVYLLALARHHGAKLATFDRGIPAEAAPDGRAALAILDASAA